MTPPTWFVLPGEVLMGFMLCYGKGPLKCMLSEEQGTVSPSVGSEPSAFGTALPVKWYGAVI